MNFDNNEEKNGSFYFDSKGVLLCGKIPLTEFMENFVSNDYNLTNQISLINANELVAGETQLATPIFVCSKRKLLFNFLNYKNSFNEVLTKNHGIETIISFSIKANFNPSILRLFHENGCWASLVNKNELILALKVGIKGENLIFNGNGKKFSEIDLAIRSNCFLNIDSLFNLIHTIKIASKLKNLPQSENMFPVKLVLRINQSLNAQVHQYLNTSGEACKFGIEENQIQTIIELIKQNEHLVKLSGFHSHLGSTIKTLDIYNEAVKNLVKLINLTVEKYKIDTIEMINFGGGLGIDYEKYANRTSKSNDVKQHKIPDPKELALVISENIKDLKIKNIKIIVEPGRSLVGDTAVLLTSLIGIKQNENKKFMVIDGSMCECPRPCLYSAYHHIDYIKPLNDNCEKVLVDVVGPVCESGDFLGKNRFLQIPLNELDEHNSLYLAIMDVGAYCSSMSSNYNLHQKPAEIFIDEVDTENGNTKAIYLLTRKQDTLENIFSSFTQF